MQEKDLMHYISFASLAKKKKKKKAESDDDQYVPHEVAYTKKPNAASVQAIDSNSSFSDSLSSGKDNIAVPDPESSVLFVFVLEYLCSSKREATKVAKK